MRPDPKIDWDLARNILDQLGGKRAPIETVAREFLKRGVLKPDMEAWANEQTRHIIHQLNKEARKEGRFEAQFFNFVKYDEDGEKQQYYEQLQEATAEEHAQLCKCEFRKWNAQGKKFFEIYDRGCEKHGRRFQRLLDFPIPERPQLEEPAC